MLSCWASSKGLPSLECRICGTTVDPRRVELGYDYCTADECQRRGVTPPRIARVAVNKAADQFVRAEDVVPQGQIGRTRIDDAPVVRPSSGDAPQASRSPRRRRSTLAKLQAAEAELDRGLEQCVERFERSEITADEMARMRDDLIRAFNRLIMGENIRYRSMLRRRRPG